MKIALIGTGGIAQTHVRAWLTHEKADLADLTVLCDVRPEAAEAEQIAAACRAHPNQIYLCEHRYLYDPLVIALRDALPHIGTPRWFRLRGAHANELSPHIMAMGAMLDMGYHQLYTALHFMGDATTAFALKQSLTRPDLADDTAVVVLEHPAGGSVIESSFAAVGPFGGTRPIELYGQHGTLIGNWVPKAHLTLYRGAQGERPGPAEEISIPTGAWHTNVTRHFIDCIAGLSQPLSGWQPALTTMRTYEAALRSTHSGAKEPVPS